MKNKGLLLLLGLIVVVSGWWILQSGSMAEPETGVVDVWATWGDDAGPLQSLLDRFSQASGIPTRVMTRVRSDDLQAALAGSQPPDLVILSTSDLVGVYEEQGQVAPLDAWIEGTTVDLADFYPAPLEQCKGQDGTVLCLPWGCDVDALFWNKDLFETAGLDPEQPPQTMEELVEYAAKLTRRDAAGKLSQVGFVPDLARSHTELYARMFGGGVYSAGGTKPAVNSQAIIDALNWQRQFYAMYSPEELKDMARRSTSRHAMYAGRRLDCRQCHRASSIASKREPNAGFLEGQMAMMVDSQWPAEPGTLSQEQSQVRYGVAAFPPPAAHSSRARTALIQGPVVFMPAGALDKAPAAELLAWMMSSEIMADAAYTIKTLPASRTAAQDSRFQDPNMDVFMDLLAHPNATSAAMTPMKRQLNQVLGQVAEEVVRQGGMPVPLLDAAQIELALD